MIARLIRKVVEVLRKVAAVNEEIFPTDSAVALTLITSGKSYKQYVQNRVDKIKELTSTDSWYLVSGVENIADLQSRGCLREELNKKKDCWVDGPE